MYYKCTIFITDSHSYSQSTTDPMPMPDDGVDISDNILSVELYDFRENDKSRIKGSRSTNMSKGKSNSPLNSLQDGPPSVPHQHSGLRICNERPKNRMKRHHKMLKMSITEDEDKEMVMQTKVSFTVEEDVDQKEEELRNSQQRRDDQFIINGDDDHDKYEAMMPVGGMND